MFGKVTRRFSPLAWLLVASCGTSPKDGAEPEPPTPTPEDAAFELRVDELKVPVTQGETAKVTVHVLRRGSFTGAVELAGLDLPSGAKLTPTTVAADDDEATVEVRAAADAPHSLPTRVELVGSAGELESSVELTVTVCGHPGALDTSFQSGRSVVSVGAGEDYANALALTADGKVLVAGSAAENLGDIALVRLERDGKLDASFGEAGKVTTSVGAGNDAARAIALQRDGKIVVAGASDGGATGLDFVVLRYQPNGSLDTSFGEGGKVRVALSDDADLAYALLIQEDGRIVAGGSASLGSDSSGIDFALLRLNADGSIDDSFGDRGQVLTPVGSNAATDAIYTLASQLVDGEERVVAAGGEGDFALARYTARGELDPSFGKDGLVTGVFGSVIGAARAVSVTRSGQLVVAGHASHDFALARFDEAGRLDRAFGEEGRVVTALSEDNWDEAQALALDADGKIVVGGWTYEGNGSSGNFALARYSAEGALDLDFGKDGVVVTQVAAGSKDDVANALLLQADERVPTTRVLLAGSANGSNHDFAVTRYWK